MTYIHHCLVMYQLQYVFRCLPLNTYTIYIFLKIRIRLGSCFKFKYNTTKCLTENSLTRIYHFLELSQLLIVKNVLTCKFISLPPPLSRSLSIAPQWNKSLSGSYLRYIYANHYRLCCPWSIVQCILQLKLVFRHNHTLIF